jgi:hypothetical protein
VCRSNSTTGTLFQVSTLNLNIPSGIGYTSVVGMEQGDGTNANTIQGGTGNMSIYIGNF